MMNKPIKHYEEKTHRFYNTAVVFSIFSFKDEKTILSFSLYEKPDERLSYKVNGSVDYAKKIVENVFRLFENIPVDSGDIDLCLRKAFSLRKTNTLKGKGE